MLVGLGLGDAFADVSGEVDLHPFAEEAGAGKVFAHEGPSLGAESGLFDHLALGGGEGGFVGLDATGGEFQEELAGSVAVLAFEDDVGVFGVFGFVDGEDDDGAVVADDVAGVDGAAGFLDLVGEDGEDLTLVGEFGGEEAGLLGGLGGWTGARGWGCHRATVSSRLQGNLDGQPIEGKAASVESGMASKRCTPNFDEKRLMRTAGTMCVNEARLGQRLGLSGRNER